MLKSATTSIERNVLVTLAVRAFYMLTRFLIPPYVLAYIGMESYGIWAALFVVVGYIGMSVVGFSGAYVKFTAEFQAAGDYRSINELLSTGLAITIPLYGLAFAALWFHWSQAFALTGLPQAMEPAARRAALLVVGSFLIGIAFWGFADLLNGMQRIDTMQSILLATYAIETALIFLLVGAGRGIQGLAEAFVARTVLSVIGAAWVCYRCFPWLRISPAQVSLRSLRLLLRFGGVVQVQSTLSIVLSTIERALAVPLLGPSAAAIFDLAKKLPSAIADLTGSFFSALMPAASYSAASSGASSEAVRTLYLHGARYSAAMSGILCAVPVCFAQPLLNAWLGTTRPGMVACCVLFGVATQVHLLTGPGTSILRGTGRLSGDFYYLVPNIAFLVAGLAAVRAWQHSWTLTGIAGAVSSATICSAFVLLLFAHRTFGIGTAEYLRLVLAPCLAPYGIALLLAQPLLAATAGAGRWYTAGWVMLAAALHLCCAWAALWLLFLDAREKSRVRFEFDRVRNKLNLFVRKRAVYETH